MKSVKISKKAQKVISKSPRHIREKFAELVGYFQDGTHNNCRFRIKQLKGEYGLYKQAHLDRDFRVFFREEGTTIILVVAAGTHNQVGTG